MAQLIKGRGVYLGGVAASKLYLGTTEVVAAYLGTEQVWPPVTSAGINKISVTISSYEAKKESSSGPFTDTSIHFTASSVTVLVSNSDSTVGAEVEITAYIKTPSTLIETAGQPVPIDFVIPGGGMLVPDNSRKAILGGTTVTLSANQYNKSATITGSVKFSVDSKYYIGGHTRSYVYVEWNIKGDTEKKSVEQEIIVNDFGGSTV